MSFVTWVAKLNRGIGWMRSTWGERWGGVFALLGDFTAEGAREAVYARFPSYAAEDALVHCGRNVTFPQYPTETTAAYRDRVRQAFPLHKQRGTRQGVLAALAAFGLPGALLYEDHEWDRPPANYWSQWWLVFPAGTHSYTGPLLCGAGHIAGTGLACGSGMSALEASALRQLVRQFKRASGICRDILIVESGYLCGTGLICGTGLLCGSATVGHVTP